MREPDPLTREELARLWDWERRMARFHIVSVPVLVLVAAVAFMYSDAVWVRRSALLVAVLLVGAATVLQMRQRCPRCRARLRVRTMLRLPDRCGYCGVAFERPPAA